MYDFLSATFFTVLLNMSAALALVIIGIVQSKKTGHFIIFIPYAFLSVLQTALTILIVSYNFLNLEHTYFIEYFINVFTLIELIIFSFFFQRVLESEKIKRYILLTTLLILSWFLYLWAFKKEMHKISDTPTVIESFLFIILSLLYYYGLFKNPPTIKLTLNPNFWMVTGIFLLFSLLFPLFLFKDELLKLLPNIYLNFYAANHIGYALLFSCFIKGLVCKTNQAN